MSNVKKEKYLAARVLFPTSTASETSCDDVQKKLKELQEKAAEKWGFDPSKGEPIANHPRWEYEKMAVDLKVDEINFNRPEK